jgi:hypothetical protein
MAHASCKRIWEGTLGIAISPRKKRDGGYFWSFSFVRAFRRTRESQWEYAQHFGQQHATALGTLMTKAFLFMQETDPVKFLEQAMAQAPGDSPPKEANEKAAEEAAAEETLEDVRLPPPVRTAA